MCLGGDFDMKSMRVDFFKDGYQQKFGNLAAIDIYSVIMLSSFVLSSPRESVFWDEETFAMSSREYFSMMQNDEKRKQFHMRAIAPIKEHIGHKFYNSCLDFLSLKSEKLLTNPWSIGKLVDSLDD